jgi:glycosyltransferase involved in cell wall biosynthesis
LNANAPPLRVLHLDTERGWRGGERQVLWLASELARLGHVSIVATRPDGPLAGAAASAGLEVVPIAPLMPAGVLAAWRLHQVIGRRGFQVVHAHSANAVTLGALATLGTVARLVVTRRVDFPPNRGMGTRWKYGRASAIAALSGRVREVLLASGVPAGKISVVPDGVPLWRSMTPAGAERLKALGVRPGVPLVVMVAALVGHKDPLTFVRAVAHARGRGAEFHALLVGDGFLMDSVTAEVARLGLSAMLTVAGWQDDADALIAASDVVALSSREEGQGSVLLDAMQCGKPVAATTAGGIPDAVIDGGTGLLVSPADPAELGAALARLCADPPLRQRLGAAGRARVREFGIERTAALTVEVYRRALAAPAAGG